MARIQHSNLPDDLLHEPKGAYSATEGTVYVADGNGAGSFKKIPVDSLDFEKPEVSSLTDNIEDVVLTDTLDNIPETINVNGTDLLSVPTGHLSNLPFISELPVSFINTLNKNFAEYFSIYSNAVLINKQVKKDIAEVSNKLNEVITALKNIGVIINA